MMQTPMHIACAPMGLHEIEATIRYLAQYPIEHAQLLALARRSQSTTSLRHQFVLAHQPDASICGVMFAHTQTILSTTDGATARALAQPDLQHRGFRGVSGPEETVDIFLDEYKGKQKNISRIDTAQELYVLSTLALDPAFFSQHVAEADIHDIDTIAAGAASMIQEELGYDPRRRPTFKREILNQIQSHRWWIAQDDSLRLLCRIGATTIETMQLECIWSPPHSRGYGHATRALATICAHLLKRRATLSLAVNASNERAKKLYERIGFTKYGTQRTVLW